MIELLVLNKVTISLVKTLNTKNSNLMFCYKKG